MRDSHPDEERADVLWGLSSFFVQQVDEARHAQFFSRFYDTVFSIGGGMDAQLQEVRAEVNEFAFNSLSRRLKVIGVGLPG